jgi:hypothetical protein
MSGQGEQSPDPYDSSVEKSPMKNEVLMKLSEGKPTSRMSVNNNGKNKKQSGS